MTHEPDIVAHRVETRLAALGLSPRAASIRAGRQPYAVRDILSGKNKNPKADLLIDLARALVTSIDYMCGLTDDPRGAPTTDIDPHLIDLVRRIPRAKIADVRRMLEGVAAPSTTGGAAVVRSIRSRRPGRA